MDNANAIQDQYQGYLNTPLLWQGSGPLGLRQMSLPNSPTAVLDSSIPEKLRLGKLVERFVSAELNGHEQIQILAENLQIQQGKLTLGELDCLLLVNGRPLHLEVVYKFYLYDPSVGKTALEHWIGPNRRDSLVLKLHKLKEKQLPLLHKEQTVVFLDRFNLKADQIEQQICFKAQLFLPFQSADVNFNDLNPNCANGRYLHLESFDQFKNCKIYIPTKHNWLVIPHAAVPWSNIEKGVETLQEFFKEQSAPLVWIKKPNGLIIKVFVVWWK